MLLYSVHLFPRKKSAKMALQILKFVDRTEKCINTDQPQSNDQVCTQKQSGQGLHSFRSSLSWVHTQGQSDQGLNSCLKIICSCLIQICNIFYNAAETYTTFPDNHSTLFQSQRVSYNANM